MADLDPEAISKLRVVDLREHLSNLGLPTSGLKADLIKRLREAVDNEHSGEGDGIICSENPKEAMHVENTSKISNEQETIEDEEENQFERMEVEEEQEKLETQKEYRTAGEERKIESELQDEKEKKAEEERLRVKKEKKGEESRLRIEKEAEEERLRVKKTEEETLRFEKEKISEEERLRVKKEKNAEEEKIRVEKEIKAEEERLWVEKEGKAKEEKLKFEKAKREEEQLKVERERKIEEDKRVNEERLRIEKEKNAEQERLIIEERKIEQERLKNEEKKLAEIEKLRIEQERQAEQERLRNEEKRKAELEKLRIEEEKRLCAEEERKEINKKQAEEKRLGEQKRRTEEERIREEKRIAVENERRMAIEEEMKREQERWLVEEQMRRAQEEHKKRLQAEEQKRVLEEQQRLMEEELERHKNEQQLFELQQKAFLENESKKDFNISSEMPTNSSLQANAAFVPIPTTVNIMPPPPTILMSNIPPPPPSMILSSPSTIAPTVQVSAPPTRFAPPVPINISAAPTPMQPFVTQLEKEVNGTPETDSNDTDNPEIMDTSESTSADIRLPQALEKVLALKTERAQLLGIDPDSVVQPVPATEEKISNVVKSNVVTLVSVDEDDLDDEENSNRKESKSRRRKKKKKKRHVKVEEQKKVSKHSENRKSKDKIDIDIEYVQEVMDISDPLYSQFMKIFEKFKLTDGDKEKEETPTDAEKEANKEALNPMAFRKKPIDLDDDDEEEDQDDDKKDEKPKLSKRKLKKLSRMTVAELKQKVNRPELVEMHDVTAKDPVLLLHLKASRNTVPVPRHWCFKRKYLQGKRGIEKPAFELPDFIKRTGIMEMRQALQEKEDQKTMKAKMRERVRPKLGKIDIDYQKLHDAFFKWQTKPRMTIHGDLYYEGKEFETRLKEKKPGDLSEDLRTALGMPTGPNANKCPPPWLIAMQRYGPPPSYPNLKIPGLNAPIPDGCSFGYHAGGWGKPPVDETGRPLYGDVFGTQIADNQPNIQEEEIDHTLWGELESESSEEEEEEEEDEEEEEEEKQEDETGLVTPAEGLITPSGFSSIPAGMETPDMIELRKRKIEAEKEGGETPALYTILPEKKTERVGQAMMGSTHIYDLAAAIPASKLKMAGTTSVPPQGIEVALDPSELEMDTAAMAARYEQTMREQQSQLEKEDLSDMVAEHAARQKNKRKKQQLDSAKPPKKYKEFKF